MKNYHEKTAVITGAASGIGRGLSQRAVMLGMNVLLSDVDQKGLSELKDMLEEESTGRIETMVTDVSNEEQVRILSDKAFDDFGSVDLLFNNAGVLTTGMAWAHEMRDWEWVMGVNVMGVVHGIKHFVPRMMAQKNPTRVINTGSITSLLPAPTTSIYNATKHAVLAISETLQYELEMAKSSVGVSVICPGAVDTQIADADRNRPEEKSVPLDAQTEATKDMMKKGLKAAGMNPDQLAEIVFDHISAEKFWIFTHPEYIEKIKVRLERIVAQENLAFVPLDAL